MTAPTIGRIVHYKLSDHDADRINAYRQWTPTDQTSPGLSRFRNAASHAVAGQVAPAMIVRLCSGEFGNLPVNLQVFVDGNFTYWAEARTQGYNGGQWAWPTIVQEAAS